MRHMYMVWLFIFAGSAVGRQNAPTACGIDNAEQCACPPGTDFQTGTTYAMLGANAKEVQNLIANFFNTDWVNTPLTSTSGPNNTPGSTRTFNVKTTEGTYTLTEELINFETTSDGSFVQQLAQLNIPVPYSSGNGSLSGLWATLEANYASQYETALEWIVHACFTGHPINFALFKTAGINNALAILKSRGLLKGETLGPYAVQSF